MTYTEEEKKQRKAVANKKYRASHKQEETEYQKKYYQSRREELRKRHLEWYYKNRTAVLPKQREHYRLHKHTDHEAHKLAARKWYQTHRAKNPKPVE
jgi:hypothetical protein